MKIENLFLKRKDKRYYDTDYEVSKVKIFISNFKDRQLRKLEKKSNKKIKEKENKIKELEDEIKKNKTSINKLKCISCQKCFTKIQRMKNIQSKIKPTKIGKQPRTTYYFWV